MDINLVDSLPDNPIEALSFLLSDYNHNIEFYKDTHQEPDFEFYINYIALIKLVSNKYEHDIPNIPDFVDSESDNIVYINEYISSTLPKYLTRDRANFLLDASMEKFGAYIAAEHVYEFSDDEIQKINEILTDLRQIIGASELFDDDHRRRLLKRLEKLQSEVHKKVTDMDVFWGLIGDAGVALGKFGNDAKPIVDRVKDLTEIAWKAQAKAEGLPEQDGMPLLTHDDENSD